MNRKTLFPLMLAALVFSLIVAHTVACGGDDDDDADDDADDDDDTDDDADDDAADDDEPPCEASEVCDAMLETGFFYEEETCLAWFENEGNGECEDFDGFYACSCDCTTGSAAEKEVCLGQCMNTYCPYEE